MVLSSRRGQVRLAGMGHATDSAAVTGRQGLTSFNSTRKAAAQAYAMAQVNPEEVDFAEVHDAFTMFEVIGTEDLGFFPPGQGWRAALEGRTGVDGHMPINPSGGLKARGHPVGASGLAQVVEAYWLLTGQVDPARRLPREPQVALTQSIGGLGNNNLVTILVPAARRLHQRGSWQGSFNPPILPLAPSPRAAAGGGHGQGAGHHALALPARGLHGPPGPGHGAYRPGLATLAHIDPERQPALGSMVLLRLEGGLFRAMEVGDLAGTGLAHPRGLAAPAHLLAPVAPPAEPLTPWGNQLSPPRCRRGGGRVTLWALFIAPNPGAFVSIDPGSQSHAPARALSSPARGPRP